MSDLLEATASLVTAFVTLMVELNPDQKLEEIESELLYGFCRLPEKKRRACWAIVGHFMADLERVRKTNKTLSISQQCAIVTRRMQEWETANRRHS